MWYNDGMAGLQDDNRESFDEALARANELERHKKTQAKDSAAPVDINDSQALKSLAMEALVEIVQKAPRNVSLVGAIRELIDRIEGKAPQSIAMTVKTPGIKQLSAMQILDARNMAARYLNVDPLLIAPEPTIIEND